MRKPAARLRARAGGAFPSRARAAAIGASAARSRRRQRRRHRRRRQAPVTLALATRGEYAAPVSILARLQHGAVFGGSSAAALGDAARALCALAARLADDGNDGSVRRAATKFLYALLREAASGDDDASDWRDASNHVLRFYDDPPGVGTAVERGVCAWWRCYGFGRSPILYRGSSVFNRYVIESMGGIFTT